MNKKILGFFAVFLLATAVSAQLGSAQTTICNILEDIYDLLLYIATGVAALIVVLMGVTWIASANNPKARANATSGVVNAMIGLIIVSLAVTLVQLVESTGCLSGWN